MSYQVKLERNAEDELEKLDEPVIQRIILRINWLAINYENIKSQPLSGALQGYFKLRIGPYRAIYSVNNKEKSISIAHIGHRRDIYKRPK